jgi:two-component system cell cycle response regulator CtrA
MRILVIGTETSEQPTAQLRASDLTWDHVTSNHAALSMSRDGGFDAIVIDSLSLSLATTSIRSLRAAARGGTDQQPIMVVLSTLNPKICAQLLDAGADDVVSVNCDPLEMLARLRAVVRRSRGFARPILSFGPMTLDPLAKQATIHGRPFVVTPKEFKTLEVLTLRQGRVLSKSVLLERIYDTADCPDDKVMDVMICRLRKKLVAAGAPGLISTAWGSGYVLRALSPIIPAPTGGPDGRLSATLSAAA